MEILLLAFCFGILWSGSFSADCGCAREQFSTSAIITYKLGPNGEHGTYQNRMRYEIDYKNMRMREDVFKLDGRRMSTLIVDLKNDIGWLQMPGILDCEVIKPIGEMDERCSYGKGNVTVLGNYEVDLPKFPGKLIASFDKLTCDPINFSLVTAKGYTGSTKLMVDVAFDYYVSNISEGSFAPLCDGKPSVNKFAVPSMRNKVAVEIIQGLPYLTRRK